MTTNADVLTKDKLAELRRDAKNEKPDIIAVSEVKPKNYEKMRTLAEYKIKGYLPEPLNIDNKVVGRGMLVYIVGRGGFNNTRVRILFRN